MPPRFLRRIDQQSNILRDVFGNPEGDQNQPHSHLSNKTSSTPQQPFGQASFAPPTFGNQSRRPSEARSAHANSQSVSSIPGETRARAGSKPPSPPHPPTSSHSTSKTIQSRPQFASHSASPSISQPNVIPRRPSHGTSLSISSHTEIKTSTTTFKAEERPTSRRARSASRSQRGRSQSRQASPPRTPPALPRLPPSPPPPFPAELPLNPLRSNPPSRPMPTRSVTAAPITTSTTTPSLSPLTPPHPAPTRRRAGTGGHSRPRTSHSRARSHSLPRKKTVLELIDRPLDSLILVVGVNTPRGMEIAQNLLENGYRVRGCVRDAENAVRSLRTFRERFGPGRYTPSVVAELDAGPSALKLAVRSCAGVVVVDEGLPDVEKVLSVLDAARREPDGSVGCFVYVGIDGPMRMDGDLMKKGAGEEGGRDQGRGDSVLEGFLGWAAEQKPPVPKLVGIPPQGGIGGEKTYKEEDEGAKQRASA